MDAQLAHTFPEARTYRLLVYEFGDMPSRWAKVFQKLITQDETWVYHYDPETKAQSM